MIRFNNIAPTENGYPFVKAVAKAEYKNGTVGTVTKDVFTAGNGAYYIDQVETGDDMYSGDFKIKAGADVRIVDMGKAVGATVNITKDNLPETYAVGNVLVAGTDGMLTVGSKPAGGSYFEVVELANYGVIAKIGYANA